MFWFKKKEKCNHHWHLLNEYSALEHFLFAIPSWRQVKYADCYCHFCDEHTTVEYERWLIEEKVQKIKLEYSGKE